MENFCARFKLNWIIIKSTWVYRLPTWMREPLKTFDYSREIDDDYERQLVFIVFVCFLCSLFFVVRFLLFLPQYKNFQLNPLAWYIELVSLTSADSLLKTWENFPINFGFFSKSHDPLHNLHNFQTSFSKISNSKGFAGILLVIPNKQ